MTDTIELQTSPGSLGRDWLELGKMRSVWIGGWVVLVFLGFTSVWDHQSRPGEPGRVPLTWPDQAGISRSGSPFTVVMFLHPRCPCSRASVEEFARLESVAGKLAELFVVVLELPNHATDRHDTEIRRRVAAIRTAHLVSDAEGAISRQFGVTTSGTILMYDQHDRLQFGGGITPGRGHVGDSVGRRALLTQLHAGPRAVDEPAVRTPVFGCPMVDSPSVRLPRGRRG